ncbi:hypothetical protein G3T14_06585 [Methylobacterium sp. BTF04]|uniref:tetratricopeptide repeat protein n=1 Tax=Methylobacterium sp. BTF04 TaxID=2708300 RepID=UPI0013D1BEFF|nr:tetratricopeptide repeat protein [Methylobacterium sp. BTF04]NEU11796.1 hypothetical protein [Methylobacterium sp. BTF04]
MTRTAPLDLDGFDPDVLDAARDVARRAGVPVETWIASIVSPEAVAEHQKPKPQAPDAKPASVAVEPTEAVAAGAPTYGNAAGAQPSEPRVAVASPPIATVQDALAPAPAEPLTSTLAEMMRRLDAIDQRIAQDQKAAQDATTRSIEGIEARLSTVIDSSLSPAAQMAQRFGEIERRMTELGEQLATPRPLGRRGRAAGAEIRDAVSEIRQRQRELDAGGTVPSRAVRADTPMPSLAVAELQRETSLLRESIDGLASGRDVSALENAMQTLVAGVQKAQEPADLAAIAAPIAQIREQVAKLADEVAENVHVRVAADVERLTARVDGALQGGSAGTVEQDALAALFRELDEIRRLIATLAGPERIQSLAAGLQAISAQIAELQNAAPGDASGMAELRPLLEEIRSGLRGPLDSEIGAQIQVMGEKLDALRDGAPLTGGANSDAIIHRIDALSEKVDRVGINPVGDLINRLEDLGATLRRPVVPGEDIASIHGMLHDLAVKLDRIGTADGPKGEGLDALENQVLALAGRIDSRDADPALAGLERTMSDLLTQVSALRTEAPMDAAVERAARNAAEPGELGLLRASLADLRAHQTASEQRMQSTLTGVYSALERLVGRLGTLETEDIAASPPRPAQSTSVRGAQRPDRKTGPSDAVDLADLPLEPGAGRPGRERSFDRAEPAENAGVSDGDIKTSFIAAARRAAQAAQAEASGATTAIDARDLRKNVRGQASADAQSTGRLARLRAEIDKRRKPLLLGLAAIVLVLGALQAVGSRNPAHDAKAPDPAIAPVAETASPTSSGIADPATKSAEKAVEPAPAAAPLADPVTTQSLADTKPVSTMPAAPATMQSVRSLVPRVASMASLTGELSTLPAGLAKLRQAVTDGEGASIYELAIREAEGRGVPRDYALAAKLFEKLASTGYAPAQYKLASFYEKGTGLTRDLAQAKLWYGRAAEQGHARSMHNIAVIHAENPAANGKPDFATAAQWFKRAAEYGLRDSQYNLAVLYARGLGQPQDLTQSYLWFSAAAAQGDEDAAKKRDDVASKLDPKALAAARSLAAAFKPKVPDAAVNEPPALAATDKTMTLLGAPVPTALPAAASPRRG